MGGSESHVVIDLKGNVYLISSIREHSIFKSATTILARVFRKCETLTAIPMEQITEDLSRVQIGSELPNDFRKVFEEIVKYASELRGYKISDDEIKVTRKLAAPFTPGGFLVLLIEPRQKHPWASGVYCVVEDCATLNALRQGFHIASNGALSLFENVSILDIRPFIWSGLKQGLKKDQLKRLYDLVIEAIYAKCPDTILCMGKVSYRFPSEA